jgi:Uma2 family endonuclease
MALTLPRELTVDDLEGFPSDGHRYELYRGSLIVSPSPAYRHQRVVTNLVVTLQLACPENFEVIVSPFDWRVSRDEQWQPDLLVIRRGDAGRLRLEVPPVLAVEVLSRSTRSIDLGLKRQAYAEAAVPHYWVVDPEPPAFTTFRLAGDAYDPVLERATGPVAVEHPFPLRVDVDALAEP